MNAERLLAHFERISEAPDAITRLRRFILDLAVRGKLVEQREAEIVSDHLDCESQIPFEIPATWRIVRLGAIFKMVNGRAFKPSDWIGQGLPIVRIQNLNNVSAPFNYCDPELVDEKHLIDTGSFLISWSGTPGTSFGAFIWDRGLAALNQHIFKCLFETEAFCGSFLRLAINGRLDELIKKAQGGVGLQHVTKGKLEALTLPLPPLAEQHRIVAKVDELMALCDQMKAARHERQQGQQRLVAASLQRLNQPAEDPESFRQDASFALQVLPSLTTTSAQIKLLRQTILNLAVRGKLVEQDPEDEPAEDQLERIIFAKVEAGRKQRASQKQRENLTFEPLVDDLPSGWVSASLAGLVTILNGRAYKQAELLDSGTPVLRVGNLFTSNKWYYSNLELDDDKYIDNGDLIFAWSASFGPFIWKGTRVIYHYHIWKLPLHSPEDLSQDYLYLYLLHKTAEIKGAGHGISMVHMTKEKMEVLEVSLPPLAEQHRIVAKVDELMALCDQLEQQLNQADQQRRRLLEAVLAEALGGRLTAEEDSHAAIA